ncbi:MAG: Rne/Rng family ribonuclease [Candidatus Electrothrix aestuarii]|uniref:Ribonuclease G n=1 Tax=Candidatus Electrothrix aestuarii TaxID=3062594 RepID=A0AAU8LYQ4_9BACT|nr:Rne/Rng family ribonuclease [Candidatus Electrothrix aestuarii]
MTNETEKEKNEQQPSQTIRKVTTGAWWKSFKKKRVEKSTQVNGKAKEEAKGVTSRKSQQAKPAKKKQVAQTPQPSQDTQAPKDAQTALPEKEEIRVEAAPASKQVDSPPSLEIAEAEKISPEETTAPAQQEAAPASPEQIERPEPKEEKKRPSRRPRRKGKKPSPPQEAATEATEEKTAQKSEPTQEAKGESQEAPAKSTPQKTNRKKRNRKPSSTATQAQKDEQAKQEESAVTGETTPQQKKQKVRLLINAEEPEECRIALVEDGRLESFHVSTVVRERTKNNIYKGRIVSIEANLQAAFVEIGTGRNGFLPFNDIHPEYYRQDVSEQTRALINQQQWKKLKIEDVIKRGQEVLVQVVKEVTGNKGANMTTYLSLPGRCLVLMPGSDSAGISRKISGEKRRSELRKMMSDFDIPEGVGYIVRTACAEITKTGLQQDLRYLIGLWRDIKKRGQSSPSPTLLYEDQDTVQRFLRDHFTQDIQEIIVDTEDCYNQVSSFVELLPSRQQEVQVRLHRGAKPIFNQNNIEEQIESIYQPQVQLLSGGSIVIDPTEALVAIDVNSGRTSQKDDFEQSIFLANMEAAEELARQLRLRDLGGLIVVDFIDMRSKNNIKEVEKKVKNAMKRDKAKVDISRISRFGLMQISRQKMGAPIEKGSYRRCEHCEGRGVVRSVETLALYYLRRIQTGVTRKKVKIVEAELPLEVGQYLLNKKRAEIMELENKHQARIIILPNPGMKPSENNIRFLA